MSFRHIYLEITNVCNLKCPFCKVDHRPQTFMNLKEFKKYVNMISEYTNTVYLHIKGEPLLHPELFDMLDYLKLMNMKVKITTNGSLLGTIGTKLLEYDNILRINVSLQSLITKNASDIKEYLETLHHFLDKATLQNTCSISLRLWNDSQKEEVSRLNEQVINDLENYYSQKFEDSKALIPHVYCSMESEFTWPDEQHQVNQELTTCLGGTTHIGILVNGDVVLCCLDSEGSTKFGNLHEKQLCEILSSDDFTETVRLLKQGKYQKTLCMKCQYRNRFKK